MKKIIAALWAITIFFTMSISVFAGDIPEALLSNDSARLFIGIVDDIAFKNSSSEEIDSLVITPTEKIKGEVEAYRKETHARLHGMLTPQKGREYLFCYIDENNLYAYGIESRDEKSIRLVDSDKYDMTKRLEDYINEGAFAAAEKERQAIGNKISFAELLCENSTLSNSDIEKVTLRYRGELYEVDKDKFIKTAESITVTNVKNDSLYDVKQNLSSEEVYSTVLFVELTDTEEQCIGYATVSRFGEVDKYSRLMSRYMKKDYEMEKSDLSRLYSLLPSDVQKQITTPEGAPSDDPLKLPRYPKEINVGYAVGGTAVLFVIAFALGFVIRKNKHK